MRDSTILSCMVLLGACHPPPARSDAGMDAGVPAEPLGRSPWLARGIEREVHEEDYCACEYAIEEPWSCSLELDDLAHYCL